MEPAVLNPAVDPGAGTRGLVGKPGSVDPDAIAIRRPREV